jgi:hypothetical protein
MLQTRLTIIACVATLGLLTACGGEGVIEKNVIRPGITALDQSKVLACEGDAETIRVAMEAYELLESAPAPDEATLVAAQYLKQESEYWNIANGQLVAQDPDCATVTPIEIVTEQTASATADVSTDFSTELAAMTPESVVAGATEAEIAEVGGRDCALEVARVGLAFGRSAITNGVEPSSIQQLLDDGTLEPLTLWTPTGMILDAAPGSACIGPVDLLAG